MKNTRIYTLTMIVVSIWLCSILANEQDQSEDQYYFNVKNYGAIGNGKIYDTAAIQKAIDKAFSIGGGIVVFPAGKYLTKTIILKDNITLRISNGAKILGSTDMSQFLPELGSFKDSGGRKFGASILFAKDVKNITISNCTFYGTRGINLITVDGGTINNVTISNISMRDSYAVIIMRLGDRMRPYAVPEEKRPMHPGEIKNILINNIQAVGVTESNDFIFGIPGHYIENSTIEKLQAESSINAAPFIRLIDTKDADIRFCKPLNSIDTFLYAEGDSKNITLQSNSLARCKNKKILDKNTAYEK